MTAVTGSGETGHSLFNRKPVMKILFMDISRNEDGDVLSVVGGCRKCDNRVVTCFIDEASAWLKDHQYRHHKSDLSGIEQIGDSLKGSETTTKKDAILILLEEADEELTVSRIVTATGSSYNTVSVALNRLHKAGKVKKETFKGAHFWTAA